MAINLIPPQLKAEKAVKKRNLYISAVFITILLLLVLASAFLYIKDLSIKNNLNDVNIQITEKEGALVKHIELQKKIDTSNKKLSILKEINTEKYLWSVIIKDIAASTPSVVYIRQLSLDSENKTVSLTGIAETRRDIAKFKEKLEQSKFFQNVVFSSSSVNKEANNYNFSLSAELEDNGNE